MVLDLATMVCKFGSHGSKIVPMVSDLVPMVSEMVPMVCKVGSHGF